MPVEVKRTLVIDTADGGQIIVGEKDKPHYETRLEFSCSGPKCAARHDLTAPAGFCWEEEKVQEDPNALPDEFFRLIKIGVNPANPKEFVFCSTSCAKDWLTYSYVPEKSPREQAVELSRRSIGEPGLVPVPAGSIESIPDATGLSE